VGERAVASPVPGSVWKLLVEPGAAVREGQPLLVIESMKMEFTIAAPGAGRLRRLLCREGGAVAAGQTVAVIDADELEMRP
jgi:urea carboxylase